ncbi:MULTISPECIES: cell division protein SepF [unclassified Paenibacillus]|uniref:cell division protein SepF n=1 Tax=unclassified Paenibacillus TaxID=185978 RepID=UPI0009545EE4|nr:MULTISPECIES: cell division protein SepF [unclassified Paenibacillus]ASS65944.1 cell division protein SepF [Paenibacillus sp. RUD330]SIQ17933.1 cell division inhibitor SepF [Paenibacillus sp. RU4X]SIQ39729.1 cell division inhibitor SepF [Paenibacillus sp. RU4T]
MKVLNRFMNYFGLQDEEEIIEREPVQQHEDHEVETSASEMRKPTKGSNIVSIHSQKNMRVVLNEPRSYDEAQEIADHLRNRRSVIVNLQRVRTDLAVRIVDFLSGTVYALNGSISKLGPNIFLCTPDSVDVQGTITEMLADEDYRKMR